MSLLVYSPVVLEITCVFIYFYTETEPPAWEDVEYAMISTKIVVHGLVEFISHHSHTKKILEQQVGVCISSAVCCLVILPRQLYMVW